MTTKDSFRLPKWIKGLMMLVVGFLMSLAILRSSIHQEWPDTKSSQHLESRKPMAELELVDIDGRKTNLSSLYGSPTIVSFWATWCQPCLIELPEFAELKKKYGERIKIIAINQDSEGNPREFIEGFWQKYKIPFETYFDPGHVLASKVGLEVLPTNFILDKKGKIVFTTTGYVDWTEPQALRFVDELIAE